LSEEIVISAYVQLGKNVKIKPFTAIGLTGFGFEQENGKYKIPLTRKEHNFKVIIGDNVEIGAGCVIDRGSWRDSVIGAGTKIDNMVHTGHNTVIGKNCIICVGTTLGGSTTIGDNCFLGMNCITKQGIKIANNVTIGMGAVVTKDITEENTTLIGNPARQLVKQEKNKKKVLGGGYIGW
jgi:UDP-3-O-[3-hydroxymyristoyl] glucosamine N-acyltransferase